jgi:hypothetical protein
VSGASGRRSAGEIHRRIHRALEVLDIADVAAALDDPRPFGLTCREQADQAARDHRPARAASWRALGGCPPMTVRDVLAARGIVLFARDRRSAA